MTLRPSLSLRCVLTYQRGALDFVGARALGRAPNGGELCWLAPVMCLTASNGLVFPLAAAASCGVWTVGKLLYIQGYSSGDPKGRHLGGAIAHLGDLPLIVMAFVAGNKALNA